MKELSIEEKAKRYDEAFNLAEQIHMFSSDPAEIKRMEELFPILKESADERIRKALINVFASHADYEIFFGVSVEDIRAWLEKQNEQKLTLPKWKYKNDKVEPKFKVGDKIKLAREPKYPAREIIAIQDDAYYFDEVVYLPFSRQDEWELVEQKPAWSEEDEAMIDEIVKCMVTIEQEHSYNAEKNINWLKSLKDRYTWKPSDEQIKGIECAIKTLRHQLNVGDKRLNSLYDDLKKLREEL